jgi:hypothetical protein
MANHTLTLYLSRKPSCADLCLAEGRGPNVKVAPFQVPPFARVQPASQHGHIRSLVPESGNDARVQIRRGFLHDLSSTPSVT